MSKKTFLVTFCDCRSWEVRHVSVRVVNVLIEGAFDWGLSNVRGEEGNGSEGEATAHVIVDDTGGWGRIVGGGGGEMETESSSQSLLVSVILPSAPINQKHTTPHHHQLLRSHRLMVRVRPGRLRG